MKSTREEVKDNGLQPVTITRNEEISPGVFVISWERAVEFEPGQVVKITTDLGEPPRIYSICSGNKENELSVLFNVKPDGTLTPRLSQLGAGDRIYVSLPYGNFSIDEAPAWCIAAGTGIAPFYSMIRSGRFAGKRLIHGVSYARQFYFQDYLEEELGDCYLRCCSREKAPGSFPGRVTDYLSGLERLPQSDKYYLCGQALMVVEVRDLLIQKGVPFDRIYAEIFF